MTTSPHPPDVAPRVAAERAVGRAVGVGRVSSWVMLVLGGLSMLVSITRPLSAGFAISVAVIVNGWVERRMVRRLAAHDRAAPARLAFNQLALGLEVLAYAAWQAHALGPEQIDAVLRRPLIAQFLAALEPGVLGPVLEALPAALRIVYLVVGAGTFLGCAATAGYYLSRSRALRQLADGATVTNRSRSNPSP